ncbi:MAG: gamma carbonic anhydrase family protein [Muribaculaceae bacterium]|nr:gamma carbonic anhydrase family protein [Muribaculaceae bacterium]
MALIIPVRGFTPVIGKDCFFAENATIVGDVVMGDNCSVWFNAVLRGDVNSIKIGNHVNIQDGSVLHTLYQKSTIEIGDHVSIGHNVTIHGSKIHDYALIGMGAVVMDDAVVGEGALVAAGSVVLSKTVIGPNELWGGAPAKFIKMVEPEKAREMNIKIAHNYLQYSRWYTDPDNPNNLK